MSTHTREQTNQTWPEKHVQKGRHRPASPARARGSRHAPQQSRVEARTQRCRDTGAHPCTPAPWGYGTHTPPPRQPSHKKFGCTDAATSPDFKHPVSPAQPLRHARETAAQWKLCCGLRRQEKRHNSSTSLPTPALCRKEKTPPGISRLWWRRLKGCGQIWGSGGFSTGPGSGLGYRLW